MIHFRNYVQASSLEEAWNLNQKKSNRIVGGMLWLRLENLSCDTAIDLSGLDLDRIEETEEEFRLGSMVTLRDLETHEGFLSYTGGAVKEALEHIVGVQFRNMATLGGTVYGRYGFSDVLTLLLALDTHVILYKGGEVDLNTFLYRKPDRDLITHIVVKKTGGRLSYHSVRPQKTDFPTLTMCLNYREGAVKCVYGARPGKAKVLGGGFLPLPDFSSSTVSALSKKASEEIAVGSNFKASGAYRTRLIKGLTERGLKELEVHP